MQYVLIHINGAPFLPLNDPCMWQGSYTVNIFSLDRDLTERANDSFEGRDGWGLFRHA